MNRRDFIYTGIGGVTAFTTGLKLFSKINDKEVTQLLEDENKSNVREYKINAEISEIDIGDKFKAWTYNSKAPGPEIRVKEGEIIRVVLKNNLPDSTTIHWHGIPVPNAMDGVPGITQEPIKPGETFVYEFKAQPAGSYLYHSHVGYQLDQGLYGPLIVEPERELLSYDREYTIVLADWAVFDGGGPEASRAGHTRSSMDMMGRGMGMMHRGGRGMIGRFSSDDTPLLEPNYDAYTINGKVNKYSTPFMLKEGDRVRLRIMNPSSATIYTLRLAGHSMTITHADGRPVKPFSMDALRIGMGERYDVLIRADNPGRWSLYTLKDGTPAGGYRLATFLYKGIQGDSYSDDSFSGRFIVNRYWDMEGIPDDKIPGVKGEIDRRFNLTLSGGMMGSPYWTINGRIWPETDDLNINEGERVRIEYFNHSMMPHPMHLHGHFFEVVNNNQRKSPPLKDTIIIEPHMGTGVIDFVADNPGDWFHHCHNLYHLMGGMANVLRYR
ncbi:multicopper oxidase domain-containing protein [Candidatus Poribacteria bacterium]|nr:multicopper oxidase domain-containing protein [Candidatus Poribacteria bacterium]